MATDNSSEHRTSDSHKPRSIRIPMPLPLRLLLVAVCATMVLGLGFLLSHLFLSGRSTPETKQVAAEKSRPDPAKPAQPAPRPQAPAAPEAKSAAPTMTPEIQVLLTEARKCQSESKFAHADKFYRKICAMLPTCVEAWLGSANAQERQGQMEQAWQTYERALTSVVTGREALNRAFAAFAMRCGQPETALAQAEEALRDSDSDAPTHVCAARALLLLGRGGPALEHADRALALAPDSAAAGVARGMALTAVGRPKEAMPLLEKVAEETPADAEAGLALAQAYRELGDTEAARNVLARVQTNKQAKLQEVLVGPDTKLPPGTVDSPDVLAARAKAEEAELLLREGKVPEAIASLRKLAEAYPELHSVQNRLGQVLLLSGKAEEARILAQKQLERHPGDAGAHLVLARVFLSKKIPGLARESCLNALKGPPGTPVEAEATKLLAIICNRSGEHADAVTHMQAYLKLRPDDVDATIRLAAFHAAAGDMERGKELLEETARRFPDNPRVQSRQAAFLLHSGNKDAAAKALESAVERGAQDPRVYLQLATLLEQKGELQDALTMAREGHRRAPRLPLAADTLGWCLLRNGQLAEAMESLNYANTALPNAPRFRYHLAVALERSGKSDEAIQAVRTALASTKEFPEREDAEELLARLSARK